MRSGGGGRVLVALVPPAFYEDTTLVDAKGRLAVEADFLRWTLSDGAGAVVIEPTRRRERRD